MGRWFDGWASDRWGIDEELADAATINVSDGQGFERGGEGEGTELVEKMPYASK